ncbi:unnamed protein product [Candida verbasci]|uniref:FAD/NAD(P)-binding domain-containing protein n=1 Tax=Candida verbasci TaxID=1227364 RepID=A0A9W4TUQ7_9ASCO|nr:unnamed protein product [Candida verbasci]
MTIESKNIIIIGASYAGILALKSILNKTNQYEQIKLNIIVITPNDKAFYNVATPRLLIEYEKIDNVLFSIKETVDNIAAKYSNHSVNFIQGTVKSVDLENHEVVIQSKYKYDNLIIASGSRSIMPCWKLDNEKDQSLTINSIKHLSQQIKNSKSIAIIGGGTTGVETSGELASNYSDKKITLYSGSKIVLQSIPCLSSKAEDQLKKLGVEIINNKQVEVDGNKVKYDDIVQEYDLVIQAQKLIPNSEFLPNQVLENGYVKTDEFFRLHSFPEVICLGDILSIGSHSLVDLLYNQKNVFDKVISYEIFKDESILFQGYKQSTRATMVVPIGKNGGVGVVFGIPIPSFLVYWIKSRDYMISKARDNLT